MTLDPLLRRNILYLGGGQLAQLLIPLLTLPHLARRLGAEGFGEMAWVLLVMQLGVLWVDFGFGWSVTRDIATHRADRARISALAINTWMVQAGLGLVFAVGALLVAFLWAPSGQSVLYAAGLTLVLGQVLLPLPLFQGMEWMQSLVVSQLLGKLLSLVLILTQVQGPQDLVWAVVFMGIAPVMSGMLLIIWLWWHRRIDWHAPSYSAMRQLLRHSTLLFVSQGLISTYNLLIPLGVGWWAGPIELAWFNLADRLRKAVQAVLAPVCQALFPRMSWLAHHNPAMSRHYVRRMLLALGAPALVAGVVLWAWAPTWMAWLGGPEFAGAVPALRWMAFIPWLALLSQIMGVQIMLPRHMYRPFTTIFMLASLTSLLLMQPMIKAGGAFGAAQLLLAVEILVSTSMFAYLLLRWRARRTATAKV
ncbi:MAG: oligosaccharide flippase family protein [Alphaproteobacteria bacterium]|nr:oligosaccharide flippase family protein [Alphaproteobacteria bacterium]